MFPIRFHVLQIKKIKIVGGFFDQFVMGDNLKDLTEKQEAY